MNFELQSKYQPTGDQPQAIEDLCKAANEGVQYQTLLGVTGSGKTFTMANVIERLNRPTLILSHNKTLAAQLYAEFKNFFPTGRNHRIAVRKKRRYCGFVRFLPLRCR